MMVDRYVDGRQIDCKTAIYICRYDRWMVDRKIDSQMVDKHIHRYIIYRIQIDGRQTYRSDRQIDRRIDRQIVGQIDRQQDRQIDIQINDQIYKYSNTIPLLS